jgi:hypothetical protein
VGSPNCATRAIPGRARRRWSAARPDGPSGTDHQRGDGPLSFWPHVMAGGHRAVGLPGNGAQM